MERRIVLGHRGSPREAPENTLRSFRLALAQGADGVELDVRQCATGEVVVCHDASLARLAGVDVRVGGSSAWSLRTWNLGDDEHVPFLHEVLAEMRGRIVNVEIKTDDGDREALVRAVVDVLRGPQAVGVEIIVSSFDGAALSALRRLAPEFRRGLLLSDDPVEAAMTVSFARDAHPWSVHPHHSLCTAERVASWRALGLRVNAWTVDEPAEIARLYAMGVQGVISNRPSVAVSARDALTE